MQSRSWYEQEKELERISHMPAFGSRAGEMARRRKQIEKDKEREARKEAKKLRKAVTP